VKDPVEQLSYCFSTRRSEFSNVDGFVRKGVDNIIE